MASKWPVLRPIAQASGLNLLVFTVGWYSECWNGCLDCLCRFHALSLDFVHCRCPNLPLGYLYHGNLLYLFVKCGVTEAIGGPFRKGQGLFLVVLVVSRLIANHYESSRFTQPASKNPYIVKLHLQYLFAGGLLKYILLATSLQYS